MREHGEAHATYIKSWRNASPQHWYDIAIGSSQAHISLTVNSTQKKVAVEIYINDNKELYAKLDAQRDEIETKLALKLDWQELPDKKAAASSSAIPATSWTRRSRRSSFPGWSTLPTTSRGSFRTI